MVPNVMMRGPAQDDEYCFCFLILGPIDDLPPARLNVHLTGLFLRSIQPLRCMEPDELLVPPRFAGSDDPHCHPAVVAQASSAGACRYLAAWSVLHPGRSNCSHLLSFGRITAQRAPRACDGLLSAGRDRIR